MGQLIYARMTVMHAGMALSEAATAVDESRDVSAEEPFPSPSFVEIDDSVCSDGGKATEQERVAPWNLEMANQHAVDHSREEAGS